LVEAFENKQDVYKLMASQIYGIPPEQVTTGSASQRQVGKTVVLGAGYGVGHKKLQIFLKQQAGVEVTEAEAKRIIDAYRNTYYKIPELWRQADEALIALRTGNSIQVDAQGLIKAIPGKGLTLPSGLFIQYPDLAKVTDEKTGKDQWRYFSKGVPVYIYGGKVVENVCQAVARQVVGEQMLRIGKKYKVVLTVHDSIATIVPEQEREDALQYIIDCMSWRPKWAQGLPLDCEASWGKSYGG
jgi:DNA polymerase